jgi:hypothetical protein
MRQLGALIPMVVLALVLLLSQALGLLHGIVHGPSSATGHAVHVAHEMGEPDRDAERFFSRLFSGHEDDADCRLYDQSSHFDLMPDVPVLALPLVLQPFVFSVLPGLAVARWHALFEARGPPSVR